MNNEPGARARPFRYAALIPSKRSALVRASIPARAELTMVPGAEHLAPELESGPAGIAVIDPELMIGVAPGELPILATKHGWTIILDCCHTERCVRAMLPFLSWRPAAVVIRPFDEDRLQSVLHLEALNRLAVELIAEIAAALQEMPWEVAAAVVRVCEWGKPLDSVEGIAAAGSISIRTLHRLRIKAGLVSWRLLVDAARVARAYPLLRDRAMPLDEVARVGGFGGVETLTHQVARTTRGLSPIQLRFDITGSEFVAISGRRLLTGANSRS